MIKSVSKQETKGSFLNPEMLLTFHQFSDGIEMLKVFSLLSGTRQDSNYQYFHRMMLWSPIQQRIYYSQII